MTDKPSECSICGAWYILESHIETIHSDIKDIICKHCSFAPKHLKNLKQHITFSHSPDSEKVCNLCGFGTTRLGKLKRHVRVIHDKKSFLNCPICGHVSFSTILLDKHLKISHNEVKDKMCTDCGFATGLQHLLKAHIAAAHFQTNKNLNSTQPAQGALISNYGGKNVQIKSNNNLKRGETAIKPYSIICANNVPGINRSGDAIKRCKYCPYTGNFVTNLVHHIRTIHPELRENICEICGFASTNMLKLKQHMEFCFSISNYEKTSLNNVPKQNKIGSKVNHDTGSNNNFYESFMRFYKSQSPEGCERAAEKLKYYIMKTRTETGQFSDAIADNNMDMQRLPETFSPDTFDEFKMWLINNLTEKTKQSGNQNKDDLKLFQELFKNEGPSSIKDFLI